jgi:hypothetical protein
MASRRVTPNHYHTLGVTPWAEDAVIRAAYVALMRTYHPDRNNDPQAQARVREITSAFAVLGDRQKRAAYDALGALQDTAIGEGPGFAEPRPPNPPMRNMGLAAIALAAVMSLTLAVWPKPQPATGPRFVRTAVGNPQRPHIAPIAEFPAARKAAVEQASASPAASPPTYVRPVPARALPQAHASEAATVLQKTYTPAVRRRKVADAVLAKPAASAPRLVARTPTIASVSPATPNDRRVQVERIASGFLRQSLAHANPHKQQLLLGAGSRSVASRAACHSDDCVTNAYLRQIRETTAIVEGRNPNP